MSTASSSSRGPSVRIAAAASAAAAAASGASSRTSTASLPSTAEGTTRRQRHGAHARRKRRDVGTQNSPSSSSSSSSSSSVSAGPSSSRAVATGAGPRSRSAARPRATAAGATRRVGSALHGQDETMLAEDDGSRRVSEADQDEPEAFETAASQQPDDAAELVSSARRKKKKKKQQERRRQRRKDGGGRSADRGGGASRTGSNRGGPDMGEGASAELQQTASEDLAEATLIDSPPEHNKGRKRRRVASPNAKPHCGAVGEAREGGLTAGQFAKAADPPHDSTAQGASLDQHPGSAADGQEVAPVPVADDAPALRREVERMRKEVAFKDAIIGAQRDALSHVATACACTICLELVWRPHVLVPCGHVFCARCLVGWFKKPQPGEQPLPTYLQGDQRSEEEERRTRRRKKLCPHCRAAVTAKPVEVWLVKSLLERVETSVLDGHTHEDGVDLRMQYDGRTLSENLEAKGENLPQGEKLWERIFDDQRRPDYMYDEADGVYRCGACHSEIWGQVCINPDCGMAYSELSDFDTDWTEDWGEDMSHMLSRVRELRGPGASGPATALGNRLQRYPRRGIYRNSSVSDADRDEDGDEDDEERDEHGNLTGFIVPDGESVASSSVEAATDEQDEDDEEEEEEEDEQDDDDDEDDDEEEDLSYITLEGIGNLDTGGRFLTAAERRERRRLTAADSEDEDDDAGSTLHGTSSSGRRRIVEDEEEDEEDEDGESRSSDSDEEEADTDVHAATYDYGYERGEDDDGRESDEEEGEQDDEESEAGVVLDSPSEPEGEEEEGEDDSAEDDQEEHMDEASTPPDESDLSEDLSEADVDGEEDEDDDASYASSYE